MSNEVKHIGKIRYIEPNDFLNNDTNDNIVQAYEDYSISVDLIVKTPNRSGIINDKNSYIENTIGSSTYSFFSGTNGVMTDAPGTTSYLDLLNGNTQSFSENLGITNINIRYNSYFYPEVTINFTDIRATALFGPQEENYTRYYRNLKKINDNENNSETNEIELEEYVQSFFSCLFSFPSPEFILRVKGFYGKKIEYNLIITDFRSSFNQNTGNFDATVTFIGKMYGVYTDIPMTYLLMAPYSKYNTNESTTIWEEKKFLIDNDIPMPTFLQIKEMLIKNQKDLTITSKPEILNEYILIQKLTGKLEEIKILINKLIPMTSKIGETGNISNNIEKNDIGIISSKKIENLINIKDNNIRDWGIIFKKIYDLLSEYNQETLINKINFFTGFKYYELKDLFEDNEFYFSYIPNSDEVKLNSFTKIYFDDKKINNIEKNLKILLKKEYEKLEDDKSFIEWCNNEQIYYIIFFKEIIDKIDNTIKNNEEQLKNIVDKLSSSIEESITKFLGFKPSIKNIFKILMAHLNCFTDIFSTLIRNINNQERTFDKFKNINSENLPDLQNNNIIPPFPLFKDKIDNTICYPSTLGYYTEECRFIDSFFNTLSYYEEINNKLNEIDYKQSLEILPTCISDFYFYKNPYRHVFNNDSTIHIDYIMTFFTLRYINAFYYGQKIYTQDFINNYGYLEAYNFWIANQGIDREIIDKLRSNDFNYNNFLRFLLHDENNIYINNNNACYNLPTTDKNNNSLLLKVIKDVRYVVNPVYSAFLLDSSKDNSLQSFFKDCKEKDNTKCISTSNKTPFNYILNISDNVFNSWKIRLDDADFKDISNYFKIDDLKDIINKNLIIDKDINNKNIISTIIFSQKDMITEDNFLLESTHFNDTLKTFYDDYKNENNYDLISVLGGGVPLFLNKNLTPEEFLFNLPWDSETFFNKINTDNQNNEIQYMLVNIPYYVRLFIGMIINMLEKFMRNGEIPWFFREQKIKHCVATNTKNNRIRLTELFTQFKHLHFSSSHEQGKIFSQNCDWIYYIDGKMLYRLIEILIKIVYIKSNTNKKMYTLEEYYTIKGNYYNVAWDKDGISPIHNGNSICGNNTFNAWLYLFDFFDYVKFKYEPLKDFVIYDTLNCLTEYKKWSEDTDEGGFLYFKNEYCLTEKNITLDKNNNVQWYSENNQGITFKGDSIHTTYDRLQSLCKIEKNDVFKENIESILNNTFKSEKYPTENNPFSKRYSKILIGKKDLEFNFYNNGNYYVGNERKTRYFFKKVKG